MWLTTRVMKSRLVSRLDCDLRRLIGAFTALQYNKYHWLIKKKYGRVP